MRAYEVFINEWNGREDIEVSEGYRILSDDEISEYDRVEEQEEKPFPVALIHEIEIFLVGDDEEVGCHGTYLCKDMQVLDEVGNHVGYIDREKTMEYYEGTDFIPDPKEWHFDLYAFQYWNGLVVR